MQKNVICRIIGQKVVVLLTPSLFWSTLTALNFGAQSLANLIELFVLFSLSFFALFIPQRYLSYRKITLILCVIAFIARLIMPVLPE